MFEPSTVLEELLSTGIDVNIGTATSGWTALHYAVAAYKLNNVARLLCAGADVLAASTAEESCVGSTGPHAVGVTPYDLACAAGPGSYMLELLTNYAQLVRVSSTPAVAGCITATATVTATDLCSAVQLGDLRACEYYLKQCKADPNSQLDDGTPLLLAAADCLDPELVTLLVAHGAGVNTRDGAGGIVHRALRGGLRSLEEAVAFPGVDLGMVDAEGRTALHLLAGCGCSGILQMAKLLIKRGCGVNSVDMRQHTPLMAFLSQGRVDGLLQLLIRSGADVNLCTDAGESPLHAVSSLRDAQLLLKAGANVQLRNNKGFLPAQQAEQNHLYGVANLLRSHLTSANGSSVADDVDLWPYDASEIFLQAAFANDTAAMLRALAHEPDLRREDSMKMTGLHHCVLFNNGEVLDRFFAACSAGRDSGNIVNSGGVSLLHCAVQNKMVAVVGRLCAAGADCLALTGPRCSLPFLPLPSNCSAMHMALRGGSAELVAIMQPFAKKQALLAANKLRFNAPTVQLFAAVLGCDEQEANRWICNSSANLDGVDGNGTSLAAGLDQSFSPRWWLQV